MMLIDAGADVSFVREDWPARSTALINATYTNQFDVILALLEAGADWQCETGDQSFLDALKTRNEVDFRLAGDRDGLRSVWQWLREHGCEVE